MPTHPRPRLWLVLGVTGALILAVGTAGPLALRWYDRAAAPGEKSPDAAAYAFVLTFNPAARDDSLGPARLIAPSRRGQVTQQRRDYLDQIDRDYSVHHGNPGQFSTDGGASETEQRDGAAARITTWILYQSYDPQRPGTYYVGPARPWRFELRRDSGGWRVWSFSPPSWCGGYSDCGLPHSHPSPNCPAAPPPTSRPEPSASIRPPTPCGTRA